MNKYDHAAALNTERSYNSPEIVNQRHRTIEAMALSHGEQVLDAGCGTGLLSALISAEVGSEGRVVGVDLSPAMLELATKRCNDLDNVQLQQGNVTTLALADNTFNAASCVQTLLYVQEPDAALAELYRVLQPRGRVAVLETDWRGVVLTSDSLATTRAVFDAWDTAVPSPNLPTRITPMLAATGFRSIGVRAIPVLSRGFHAGSFAGNILKSMARTAINQQALDEEQAQHWLQQFAEQEQGGTFLFCVNRFLFTAEK